MRALHQRKARQQERRFLVQGRKLVLELLGSGWPIDEVHATSEAAAALGARHELRVHPDHDLERMGTLESGNELVAVVRMPDPSPFAPPANRDLVIALDGVSDPGNLGTILRIADWFGAAGVVCGGDGVDPFNPKCVQASMGSLFRVPVLAADLPSAVAACLDRGVAVYRAEMNGISVFECDLRRPAMLVLGSESHGISERVRSAGGTAITIPRFGRAESLNVAAAAAALCLEFCRRVKG